MASVVVAAGGIVSAIDIAVFAAAAIDDVADGAPGLLHDAVLIEGYGVVWGPHVLMSEAETVVLNLGFMSGMLVPS